jgi:hypothetical protein
VSGKARQAFGARLLNPELLEGIVQLNIEPLSDLRPERVEHLDLATIGYLVPINHRIRAPLSRTPPPSANLAESDPWARLRCELGSADIGPKLIPKADFSLLRRALLLFNDEEHHKRPHARARRMSHD